MRVVGATECVYAPGEDTLYARAGWGAHLRNDQRRTLWRTCCWSIEGGQWAIHERARMFYLSGSGNRKVRRAGGVSDRTRIAAAVEWGWVTAASSEGHRRFNPCKMVPCLNTKLCSLLTLLLIPIFYNTGLLLVHGFPSFVQQSSSEQPSAHSLRSSCLTQLPLDLYLRIPQT